MKTLTELSKDKTVTKELMKASSPKEVYEILTKNGYEEDYDKFIENVSKMKEVYEKKQAGLLTEQDMDDLLENSSSEQMLGTTFFFVLIPLAA